VRKLICGVLVLGFAVTGVAAAGEAARGKFREFALCDPGCGPAIVAIDAADSVWVALARAGKLVRYRDSSIDTFDLGADSRPVGLAVAPDAIWIAASYDNKIIRFDITTHQTRAYPIDVPNSWPFFVATGKDGAVWFSQRAGGKVSRLDPQSGKFRHFDPPTPNAGPAGLAIDHRSGRVWFSESYADRIAALDPVTGKIVEHVMGEASTGLASGPAGIAVDAEGVVWFAKLEGKLGRLAELGGEIQLIDTPAIAKRPAGVALDRRGDVWLAALDGNSVLQYEPRSELRDGRFTNYPIPTGSPDASPLNPPAARTSRPFGIATDRHGNIWFSEQYTGQLGVLDVAAPQVAILSPRVNVTGPSMLVTAQALDRVSGIDTLIWSIDGRIVSEKAGRIDLSGLGPGPHTLQLVATDHAGNESKKQILFNWSSGSPAGRIAVQILDAPPYFEPRVVQVRAGDTVEWKYEPTPDAHRPAHNLHAAAKVSVIDSSVLVSTLCVPAPRRSRPPPAWSR
jgi:virginiamycin B lyase